MTENTHHSALHDIDPQRLSAWFQVADPAEVNTRLGDRAALVEYLAFCNDLTPGEAAEMLEALARPGAGHALTAGLRAA